MLKQSHFQAVFFAILQLLPTCKRRDTTEKMLGIQVDKEIKFQMK